VDVTNTGAVAGKEIVQVYVHDRQASLLRPHKELKGFAKVALRPGETQTVTIHLDLRAFAFFHPGYGRWITEDGEFDILVGASSADIRGVATVTLQSTAALPSLLGPMSTLRQWLDDPVGRVVIEPLYAQIRAGVQAAFGDGADGEPDMDFMQFLLEVPLPDMLEFQGDALPAAPEMIIDGLLQQVHG
jgi:beta-glucosidase